MQFQVPQFIEIEDKIIGPLTLKQFLYLAGAGGFSFILFFVLETWLWAVATLILATAAVSLAFIRYNGRSMLVMLGAFAKYLWLPKFYLWKNKPIEQNLPELRALGAEEDKRHPLKSLLLKMSTSKTAIPAREKELPKNVKESGFIDG